ncbi:MAG: ROK family protein [Mucispirillum sp.]|nr:ROK family protein [Mucispirillum sp.]
MAKVLSLDIGASSIKSGLVDINGIISEEKRTVIKEESYNGFIDAVKSIMAGISETPAGIAVALPGGYDIEKDEIFAPNLHILNEKHIRKDLESIFNTKVLAENDANLAAYGEYVFGEKKSVKNMVFCTLGSGFGGGLILNGKLLQSNISLFEIGHISIDFHGRQCGCGRRGCLDEYCSTGGLKAIYKNITGKEINPVQLGELASSGDTYALEAFREYGILLAGAFANISALFCPEKIKFGGGLSELAEYYMQPMEEEFNKIIFPAYKGRVKIECAVLKNQAGMAGGTALFFGL